MWNACFLHVGNSCFLRGELVRQRAEGGSVSFQLLYVFHAPRVQPKQPVSGKLSLASPPDGQNSVTPWILQALRVWWLEAATNWAASDGLFDTPKRGNFLERGRMKGLGESPEEDVIPPHCQIHADFHD